MTSEEIVALIGNIGNRPDMKETQARQIAEIKKLLQPWKVIVSEQDGTGGANDRDYFFADYDLAHEFYTHIKSLAGTPFYPSVYKLPQQHEIKIYSNKFWETK